MAEEKSPDELMQIFNRSRIYQSMGMAVVVHVILIFVFSIGYLYDTLIDPEGAEERKKEKVEETQEPVPTPPKKEEKAEAKDEKSSTKAKTDEDILKERADAPVVKKITEKAKPEEIPDKPDDFGISLEDTNPGL